MTGARIDTYAEEVRLLIEERLRIKGKTLERAVARAGRLLPKWARREGRYLAQATHLMGHPKLRLMIDEAKVRRAHHTLVDHLRAIDPAERRKDRLLSILGSVSFSLIMIAGGVLAYLVWRGYV